MGTEGWGPARDRLVAAVRTARQVHTLAVETQISFLAAAIAYYAFVSMVPLVVLSVVLGTLLGGEALADRIVDVSGTLLAPAGEELLRSAVTVRTGAGGVTAVGLVVLVWGALKAFRALDRAFSLVYGTEPAASIVEAFTDALVALGAVGAGLLPVAFVGTVVALVGGPLAGSVGTVGLFAVLVVAFLPLYYLFPDAPVEGRAVLPGAAFAALGWTLLGGSFQLYATTVGGTSIYGLLGGVLLALTWFYVGALLLLVGAALNAVLSGRPPRVDR